jgi:hypothetical protein
VCGIAILMTLPAASGVSSRCEPPRRMNLATEERPFSGRKTPIEGLKFMVELSE